MVHRVDKNPLNPFYQIIVIDRVNDEKELD